MMFCKSLLGPEFLITYMGKTTPRCLAWSTSSGTLLDWHRACCVALRMLFPEAHNSMAA